MPNVRNFVFEYIYFFKYQIIHFSYLINKSTEDSFNKRTDEKFSLFFYNFVKCFSICVNLFVAL